MQSMVNSEDLPSIVHCLGRPLQLFVAECNPFQQVPGLKMGCGLPPLHPQELLVLVAFCVGQMWKEFFVSLQEKVDFQVSVWIFSFCWWIFIEI